MTDSTPPNKRPLKISPWTILAILLGPSILMIPLSFLALSSHAAYPIELRLICALPVISGIAALGLALKAGVRAGRTDGSPWTPTAIVIAAFMAGVGATIASACLLYGSCFVYASLFFRY